MRLGEASVDRKVIASALGGAAVCYVVYKYITSRRIAARLPPGPAALPFFGNLLALRKGKRLFEKVIDWSEEFSSPLITVDFGFIGKIVVINKYEVMKHALVDNGMAFAGRPDFFSFRLMTLGGKDIAFSQPDDPAWKTLRKLGFASMKEVATGKNLIEHIEVGFEFMEREFSKIKLDEGFNPRDTIAFGVFNTICRIIFNRVYESPKDEEFIFLNSLNREGIEKIGSGLLGDFVPALSFLPTSGKRFLQDVMRRIVVLFNEYYDSHVETFNPSDIRDLIDALLKIESEMKEQGDNSFDALDREHRLMLLFDVMGAGTDSSIDTLNWAILLSARHPDQQQRMFQELSSALQPGEMPNFYIREQLPFTEAFLYEVMRLCPIAPMSIPHSTTQDVELHGYHIPKGTQVWPNIYALQRDPEYWDEPDQFNPERFLDEKGKVRHNVPSFLPFSIGRRSCLGESIARPELFTFLALLFYKWQFYITPEMPEPSFYGMENPLAFVPDDSYKVCVKPRF